jgi:hypothetical protein
MAETQSQPRKVGEYERPAHTSRVGIVIGGLVLIALIILAIVLFSGGGERTGALSHEGVSYAAIECDSGAGQGWLTRHTSVSGSTRAA